MSTRCTFSIHGEVLLDGFAYDPDLAVSGFVIPYRVAARHVEIRPAKPRGDGGALHPAGPSLRATQRPADSNLVFSDWKRIFKDPMTAAIDRLVHHSVVLDLNLTSYRAEAARKHRAGAGREAQS